MSQPTELDEQADEMAQDVEQTGGPVMLDAAARAGIRIYVVDDEPSILESCESVLLGEGYSCEVERRAEDALRRVRAQEFDIVLIDQNMPNVHGLDILAEVRRRNPDALPIIMTGHATAESSVHAFQAGAWDYMAKPFTATQLLVLVGRAAHTLVRTRKVTTPMEKKGVLVERGIPILGISKSMREAVAKALKVAPTNASVFITGESGTGKELFAQYIHRESRRARRAFVAVNCAALPGELLESEMFGHKRGAFTGAIRDKAGLLEVADQGTFFLDELADMPTALQAKLLRVLQDGNFERVGEARTRSVDVRVIAATNRDLAAEVAAGRFREDLYYRLNVFPIPLAPLRNRLGDIPALAAHFIESARVRLNRPDVRLTNANVAAMQAYEWPGNVRELQNCIERAVIRAAPSGSLNLDLPDSVSSRAAPVASGDSAAGTAGGILSDAEIRGLERANTLAALEAAAWKVSGAGGAAELLDMRPTTLASRIKKLGLSRAD